MEDMARLALVEQSIRDLDMFSKVLYELLQHIYQILENPNDYDLRTIRSDVLSKLVQYETLTDYLEHIGFQLVGNEYTYPKEQALNNLRIAQAAIERKIYFCCGSLNHSQTKSKSSTYNLMQTKKPKFEAAKVLTTNNKMLLEIEKLFNEMLKYENDELQELAREQIPIVTLQLMALDRMREHQRKLKTGELTGHDLSFDIALLMELLGWFKYKFFSWMNEPECETCGGPTKFKQRMQMTTETELCSVELYKCTKCKDGKSKFARHNDPRVLLRTRRGRCGEWANCFTLLCRALGYDTRFVYDVTDHVWCEIFDYDSNSWLHVDPCEGKLNAPLMYSHGWKKKLSYVIAVSRDDLQDVTWRYTTEHKQVLQRRQLCDESELIVAIMTMREHRQRQVSEARRRYLAKRCLEELVQLMVERTASDYESHGRISGAREWRRGRGELGAAGVGGAGGAGGHTFALGQPGMYCIRYCTARDTYRVTCDDGELHVLHSFAAGAYECTNVFRKVETDWRKVYLAREEGEHKGSMSWKLSTTDDLLINSLSLRANVTIFEDGKVDWTIKFDDKDPVAVKLGEMTTEFEQQFSEAIITAVLSGGVGDVAWQHAQLFRQSLESKSCTFEILTTVIKRN